MSKNSEKVLRWRQKPGNREKTNKWARERYARNRDEIREYQNNWAKNNRDKENAYARKYYHKHPERQLEANRRQRAKKKRENLENS